MRLLRILMPGICKVHADLGFFEVKKAVEVIEVSNVITSGGVIDDLEPLKHLKLIR